MVVLNIPNILSLSRIAAIPVILFCLQGEARWNCFLAAVFFILAALTDMFDGYWARRSGQITRFGKLLDPLADKLLISSVLIMLVQMGWVPAWVTIVIICRELLVTGLRAVAADDGVILAADKFGKAKTVLQIVALVPLLLHFPWFGLPLADLGMWLLYGATVLTVYSGWNYFAVFLKSAQNKKNAL